MVKAYKVSGKMTLDKTQMTTTLSSASRDLGKFVGEQERRFSSMKRSWGSLAGQLSGMASSLGVGFSVVGALKAGDAYQAMERRIQAATKATGDFGKVSRGVFDISQRTFSDLSGTELTFRMFAMMRNEIGASNDEILRVTESVNKLGAMGGVSNEQLIGGIRQFTQVMGKGRLMAQELNIIMENMPQLGMAIIRGLGLSQGQLRKLMEEGKVSSQMVFRAILREARAVDEEFAGFAPTLGQRWNQVGNQFQKTMGEDLVGAIKAVGWGMQKIGENMGMVKLIGGVGVAVMGVNALRSAVGSLWGTIASGYKVLQGASQLMERMTRPNQAGVAAPMAQGWAKEYLDLEKKARAKGVYLPFSDQVRAADANNSASRSNRMQVIQEIDSKRSQYAAKVAEESAKWSDRVAKAERDVEAATRAVSQARLQSRVTDTIQNSQALKAALEQEAAATSKLAAVRQRSEAAQSKMEARGAKLEASFSSKMRKADEARSTAIEAAQNARAREIKQMVEFNEKGLAAAAIRDGESKAVVDRLRLIDLENAAQRRDAELHTRSATVIDRETAAYGRSIYTTANLTSSREREGAVVSETMGKIDRETASIDRNTASRERNAKAALGGVGGANGKGDGNIAAKSVGIESTISAIGIGTASIVITSAVFSAIDEFNNPANKGKVPGYATGAALANGVGSLVGGTGGAVVGAKIGGALGSIVPGAGTAVGAGAGALIGGLLGVKGGGAAASAIYHAEPSYYMMDHGQNSEEKYMGERTRALLNSRKYGDQIRKAGDPEAASSTSKQEYVDQVNKELMEENNKKMDQLISLAREMSSKSRGRNLSEIAQDVMRIRESMRTSPGLNVAPSMGY